MSNHIPTVRRDKFEPDESSGFAVPCCWCIHRHNTDREEPCRTCDHNCNAAPDEDTSEPEICIACNGSGEGMYDGTKCSTCRGKGVA